MFTFYEVVTAYGIFYASVNPQNNRLYSESELPPNYILLKR